MYWDIALPWINHLGQMKGKGMLKGRMRGNKLASSVYPGCDDKCIKFARLLVVEWVFHPKNIALLSLHWACSAGLGCSFESLGPNSAPNSSYTEICTLSASEIRI